MNCNFKYIILNYSSYKLIKYYSMRTIIICLLTVLFGFSSCEKDKPSREIDPFIQSLQGTWATYTKVYYDNEWKNIEAVLMENGSSDLEGIGGSYYTFAMDGTLTFSSYIDYPPFGIKKWWTYPCTYDQEREIIALINDKGETIQEYRVYGYDGEYLSLEYTLHAYDSYTDKDIYKYVREILKRRQD